MNERFEGIVLFQRKHREHDALVKIFTEDYGTKMFFVRGLQKPNHRLTSQLIPLTVNHYIGNINEEGLSFLKEANTIEIHREIQTDYMKQAYSSYVTQLVDAAINDNTPNQALYEMLKKALELMNSDVSYEAITISMEIKLLRYFGFDIHFDRCRICGTTVQPFDFSMKLQGVLCQKHFHEDPFRMHIAPKAMFIASRLDLASLHQINSIQVSQETIQELRRLMDEIYKEFVGINLKSKSYLNNLDTLSASMQDVIRKRHKSD